MEFLIKLHFIDIVFLILCLRISYTALRWGLVSEILRLFGIIVVVFFLFYLLPFLEAKDAIGFAGFHGSGPVVGGLVCLVVIFFASMIVGLLARIIKLLISSKDVSFLERAAALCLGMVRFSFVASSIFFCLFLVMGKKNVAATAYTYRLTWDVAPKMYLGVMGWFNNSCGGELTVNEEVRQYYEVGSVL